jgi:hypothetical protein
MAKRKESSVFDDSWRKGANAQTAIHVLGGRIVIPGDGKNDKTIVRLLTAALTKGTVRVESKK